jgi:hypothetical protein
METSKSATSSSLSLEESLTRTIRHGEELFRERWTIVEDKIRESPTKAVLIAASLGYALHRLPLGSLLASHLKLLWALAPPAVMAAAAGKGLHVLHEKAHQQNGNGRGPTTSRQTDFSGV